MKRSFSAIVFVLLLLSSCPAFAEKARSIDSDAASAYHAQHLALHVGSAVCTCTGNYVKIRAKISGDEVVGHLEQADSFELMDVKDGLALIYILDSAQTSPDSRAQMSGWVNADYIDCPCNPSEYEDADNINPLSGSVFPSGTPKEWSLLSGASAWSTELYLQSDGSFSGYYHDSDMGATGDAYPNGTLYESSFSGSFSEINLSLIHI